jgi:hypothetical protein
MRECGTSGGFDSGGDAEGEGEWLVTRGSTIDARVLPGAGGGEGKGENVLEQVILGAIGSLLVHHDRRRCGGGWGAPDSMMRRKSGKKRGEEPTAEQATEAIGGDARNRDGEMERAREGLREFG